MSVCTGGLLLTTYAVISPVISGIPVATITSILDCSGKAVAGPLPVLNWQFFMANQRIPIPNGQGSSLPGQQYDVNVAFFLVPPNTFPIIAGVSSGTFGVGGPQLIPGVKWAVMRYTGVDIGNYPGVYAFVRHATTSACGTDRWPLLGRNNEYNVLPISYYAAGSSQELFWLPCPGASTPSPGRQIPVSPGNPPDLDLYQASDVNWYPYVPGVTTGYTVAYPADSSGSLAPLEMVPGFKAALDTRYPFTALFLVPQSFVPPTSQSSFTAPSSFAWGYKSHHRGSLV